IRARCCFSPIMRPAVQACMSSAVMRREFSLMKRVCIWIAPPLVLRRVPTGRHQACRADDRPRVPATVEQIRGEHFAFIRSDEHVIGWRLLRKHGHLALDQRYPAVGAAGAAGSFEYALLNNFGAKARRRAPHR